MSATFFGNEEFYKDCGNKGVGDTALYVRRQIVRTGLYRNGLGRGVVDIGFSSLRAYVYQQTPLSEMRIGSVGGTDILDQVLDVIFSSDGSYARHTRTPGHQGSYIPSTSSIFML